MTEMQSSLQAGVARANITPPIGVPLSGFAGRGHSTGVHDDLFATALVVESDGVRAAVISCDLLYLSAAQVADIRQEVERRTEIPQDNIMVSCTHTHYGPTTPDPNAPDSGPPEIVHYVSGLKYHIAGVVVSAIEGLQPVKIGTGQGESYIGINRRERRPDGTIILGHNPQGVIDREVKVLRLDDPEGRPVASLVNFACHPVSQGSRTREISADIPGQMRKVEETLTGAACLYLQGACGNTNPFEMQVSWEPARRQGTILGCDAVRVFENIRTRPQEGIRPARKMAGLPHLAFPGREEAEARVLALESELARLRASDSEENKGGIWWAEYRLNRARKMYESLVSDTPLPLIEAELQAIRIGEVALVSCPGEPFTEVGLEIKARSPFPETFFMGYTNGSIGYIPWPSAYPEGGYEVESACQVGPDAAPRIVEGCLELLHGIWQ